MTLYRKLLISISLAFVLLFVGLFYVDYHQSRQFIAQKQFSEVKNAINTVGLALSPYLKENDPVAVETAVNALFDGSSFSSVRVVMLQTGEEIVRSYPIRGDNVPKWLVNLDVFQTIHEKRVVTSGWLQLAEIEIISHPGVAYAALWRNMVVTFRVGIASFIFSLLLIGYFVKRSLQPLNQLSAAATQIANRDFNISLSKPETQELIPVFNAFESMVVRIKAFVEEQTRQADILRTQAFVDEASTLGNRNYFISQLESKKSEGQTLLIAIIRYEEATQAKARHDFDAVTDLMKLVGPKLKTLANDNSIICARLLDDEIGVIAPYLDEQQANDLLAQLSRVSQSATEITFEIGAVITDGFTDSMSILSSVDTALIKAKLEPDSQYIQYENKGLPITTTQWVELVEDAMEHNAVITKSQLVKGIASSAYHREIFSGIKHEGNYMPAIMFLAPMEKLSKAHLYDQYIIESMIKELSNDSSPVPVAINLAPATVTSPEFITWLETRLQKIPQLAAYLHFELHEVVFIYHKEMTRLLISSIRRNGAKFGVDNYAHHLESLDYLPEFSPDYVKLDYLFTLNLDDDKTAETLSSVAKLAHDIGAFVIATRIENQRQINKLAMHNVNGLQGFAIDTKDDNE
ncbi:GGDEF domain-containing protein [Vibrio inusitatus NBRC 102082]|uniref:GGDEF domain-containing protein n=1 Tax=Vibrio inusitatus NBRC 102082 TaxID=1219070 RepID=A0A4Y3HYU2_9VIBR|nr:LapD/MoxY N-terminal periplasmic domain-containing protein [Vibrio inusitatus]GEA52171.1 GGDEF domain-containing protein [Vibrio inusitatus NBRC 102082]